MENTSLKGLAKRDSRAKHGLRPAGGLGGAGKPPQRGLGQCPRKFSKSGVLSLTKWPFLTSFQ